MTEFSPETIRVLNQLTQHGIMRGFELQHMAGLDSPDKLKDAVTPLVSGGYIAISGSAAPDLIERTQFALLATRVDDALAAIRHGI
jgi:hypothetical protein